ncbi:MAG: hypothetical protein OEZ59_02000 [Deltaproteobacteria bacterium]|nr:hypothetical protein [Deltaproteobacteria bacterium]
MKKAIKAFGALTMLCMLVVGPGQAQEALDERCTTTMENGCIDWTNGIAIAIGMGAPSSTSKNATQKNLTAIRAAKLDAARNILELVKGVNISSTTTVQNAMVENDSVNTTIQGRLFGLRSVGKPKYFSDGSIQVKLEAKLREVLPQNLVMGEEGAPMQWSPVEVPTAGSSLAPGSAYSGLIIDARGVDLAPAMSPKVYDPKGSEVYGSAFVDRSWAVQHGVVGYTKDVKAASENDRVRGNPAVIKAMEAKGANKSDLVISQADADTLRNMAQQQTFLRESRVMIVID